MDTPPPAVPPRQGGSRPALSFVLSGVMIALYFGFILLVAFAKPFLGSTITPGLSWGILLGALVIVSSWVLTLIYVVLSARQEAAR